METTLPSESSGAAIPAAVAYRDRSGGLLGFGIVQIVLGFLAALAIPLMLLGAVLSRNIAGAGMPARSYALNVIVYAFAAATLITLGVGSIRARRWARAITLIMSWMWLISGTMMTLFLAVMLPASIMSVSRGAAEGNPDASNLPTGLMAVILTFIIVFCSLFFVVLPLLFLLFYRKKDVEETVKHRNPQESWTDRCPLPALAASLLFGWASPFYFVMSFTTPLVPFFGKYLTGVPGAAGCLVFAAIDAYLAYSLFRVRLTGWWVAITALVVRTISAAITYAHADLFQAYSRMGWKDQQLQLMSQNPAFRGNVILWCSTGFLLVFLGYLIWIKRYFSATNAPVAIGPASSYESIA